MKSVVIPFILNVRLVDAAAGVTQEEGHTGFLHLPSAVLALIFITRRIQPLKKNLNASEPSQHSPSGDVPVKHTARPVQSMDAAAELGRNAVSKHQIQPDIIIAG